MLQNNKREEYLIYYLNKQNNKMRYAKGFNFLQERR